MSLVLEVAVPLIGPLLRQFIAEVRKVKEKAGKLRPTMEDLESTLNSLAPLAEQIDEDSSKGLIHKEAKTIKRLIEEGRKLVSECSNFRWWNCLKKSRYQPKLARLHNSLLRLLFLMQAHTLLGRGRGGDYPNNPTLALGVPANPIAQIKSQDGGLFGVVGGAEEFAYEYGSAAWKVENDVIFKATIEQLEAGIQSFAGKEVKGDNTVMVKATKMEVEATIKALSPAIKEEIESYSKQVQNDAVQEEIKSTMKILEEEGKKLISENNNCGPLKRRRSRKKLLELDNKTLKFHSLHLQAHMARKSQKLSADHQNAVRISEIDETKEKRLIEGGNPSHNIEELAAPAHREITSDGERNSSSIDASGKLDENESQK